MKKGLLLIALVLVLNISLISAASSTTFSLDGKSYSLELKKAYNDRSDLVLNGMGATLGNVQKPTNNTGYTFNNIFPSATDIRFALIDSKEPIYSTDLSYSTMYIAVDGRVSINATGYSTPVNLVIDGSNHAIKIKSYNPSRGELILNVNDVDSSPLSITNSPYDFDRIPAIGDIRILFNNGYFQNYLTSNSYADLTFVFQKNLTLEPIKACAENWNCSAWSVCLNNTQTRNCTDLNKCGTFNNKTNENQNCTSQVAPTVNTTTITPKVENISIQKSAKETEANTSAVCTDKSCGSIEKKSNNMLYWTVGLGITLIIIGLAWNFFGSKTSSFGSKGDIKIVN